MKKTHTRIHPVFKKIVTWVLVLAMLAGVFPNGFAMDAKGSENSESWDYRVEFTKNLDDSTYLNQMFDAYAFDDYDNATVSSMMEPAAGQSPTSTGLSWWADAWSSAVNFGGSGNPGAGYLRPVLDRKVNMLTYTMASYQNFYTEYAFVPGWSEWGFSFGAAQGAFPITWDNDSSNDTGVALIYKNDGRLYIGGAIDVGDTEALTTAKEATGKTVTRYEAESNTIGDAKYLQHADGIMVDLHNTDNTSAEQTMCVEVVGNILKVWEKSLPDNVVSVNLTTNYQGGYVSLLSNQRAHGGFKSFSIKKIDWDYDIDFRVKDDNSTYLNQAFDAYSFTDYNNATVSGKVEPAAGQSPASTGLSWWADAWSSAVNFGGSSNPGAGYLRPVLDKKLNMLTYTEASYTNFYTEYTFVPGWSEWGISFGAAQGVYPISWDKDSSNDTGVALFYKNDGRLYIGGAIDVATAKEATNKLVTVYEAETNEVVDAKYLQYADGILVDLHELDKTYTEQTMCVEVYGNLLKVWEKSLPENVVTLNLTSNYQGGFVSLLSNQRQHGGFKNFAIKRIDWDYSKDFKYKYDDSTELNDAFDAYDFTAYDNTTVSAMKEPAAGQAPADTGLGWWADAWSSAVNFGGASNPGAGYLRPVLDRKVNLLTYTKASYTNFYTEYTFVPGWSEWGISFGAEQGAFPITWDKDSSNDTGVALFYKNDGRLYIGGAIDISTAQEVTGKAITCYEAEENEITDAKYLQYADAILVRLHNTDKASNEQTLCVEVYGDTLTVWEKSLPGNVVTVKLTSNYQGGYVSLLSNQKQHGGFKNFAIKQLPDTAPIVDPMDAVAEQFDAYYLADASQDHNMASVDVKDNWAMNGEFIVAKKTTTGSDTKNVDVLTYKSQPYTDFEMSFTYQQTWQRIGVLLGAEKGVYPISQSGDITIAEGGVMFYLEAEGTPTARGNFVNGYTNVKQVMRRITGLNLQNFTDASGNAESNVNNKTEHTVKVVVKDRDLYVYVDQYTEPVLYLALPDEYAGGYVSIFSAANQRFGVKDCVISEEIKTALPEKDTGDNVYEVDFTKLHGIKELNSDFKAYTLERTEDSSEETKPSKAFVIAGNGIKRNAESQGSDWGGFNILTLANKKYKNFELELKYAQSWIRYGVMVGGELGEFAYTGDSSDCRGTHGMAFAYTEAEGYRNVKGGLTAGTTTVHSYALAKDETKLSSFENLGSVEKNVNNEVLHTMKVRVVGDYMTVVIDGNEESRMTVCIDGYNGGYISLVTNGSTEGKGAFNYLKITELGSDAVLGTELPQAKDGFVSLEKMKSEFDAYYLEDAAKTSTMKKVDLIENWWFNAQGFAARYEGKSGSESKDVDVLTYKKQKYTDFQVSFEVQQTFNRTGIIIGTEKGEFPIASDGKTLQAKGGLMIFLEAEGITNAMGDFTNGYTDGNNIRRRITNLNLAGFVDEEGSAKSNVNAHKTHKITIVVQNKELYLFVDDSSECALYLTLPESYNGGYVSLFSSANKQFGLDKFEISDTITKAIPAKESMVSKNGNTVTMSFEEMVPDASAFSTYYLKKLDNKGTVQKANFYDYWMTANGKLSRKSYNVSGSDASDVSILTYTEKTYTDFVATFEYQQNWGRLMFMFGSKNGAYPIYDDNGHKENGGVILYPECDLGSGGGICAVGDVKIATEGYRPMYRELSYAPGYFTKDSNGNGKIGTTYKMTVAVINKHCSVYIDGFGLVSSFDLKDDYKGGYISLASTQTKQHGFMNLSITEINGKEASAIVDVETKRDITVKKGTVLDHIGLPATVQVTTGSGKKVNVPVTWTDRGYDANSVGEYQFVGTFSQVEGITNPGKLTAMITVRVREKLAKTTGATKTWTFDTMSDLLDFKSFYVDDAKKGNAVASDFPAWFVRNGRLQKDMNRSVNGSASNKLHVLTYTGKTYKNFELEVDFTQQYVREMVMFGSKTPGQYINYEDPHSTENPICVYVEYEGNRNANGNVVNTNYYTRTDELVPNVREDVAENKNYYTKDKIGEETGNEHHMKVRVVGDTVSIWLDDQETVFSGKINEGYEGGYVSLVSTAQKGWFDNLSITELDEEGNPVAENQESVANGTLNVEYTKLDAPKDIETENMTENQMPPFVIPLIALLVVAGVGMIVFVTRKKSNKKEEGNS